jgi:hypothetical protein
MKTPPKKYTHNGKTQSLGKWSRETGIQAGTIRARLEYGWSIEDALTTPVTGGGDSIESLLEDEPAIFLSALKKLSGIDQELIAGYFILRTPQASLALIHCQKQSTMSDRIRAALLRLSFHVLLPDPSADTLAPIFETAGVENPLPVSTAILAADYLAGADDDELAEITESANPGGRKLYDLQQRIRSALRHARDRLLVSTDPAAQAIGARLDETVSLATRRKVEAMTADVYIRDHECLGMFRIDAGEPGFKDLFSPKSKGPYDDISD